MSKIPIDAVIAEYSTDPQTMRSMIGRCAPLAAKGRKSLAVSRADFEAYLASVPVLGRLIRPDFARWPHLLCLGVAVHPYKAEHITQAEFDKREAAEFRFYSGHEPLTITPNDVALAATQSALGEATQ